jgi:hypothetical protein
MLTAEPRLGTFRRREGRQRALRILDDLGHPGAEPVRDRLVRAARGRRDPARPEVTCR